MIVNIETYKEILGLSDVSHCRLQIPRFQGIFYFYFVLHVSGLSWGKSWNIGRDTKNSEAKQFNHITINLHRLGNNVIVHPLHDIPTGDWLIACKHFQLLWIQGNYFGAYNLLPSYPFNCHGLSLVPTWWSVFSMYCSTCLAGHVSDGGSTGGGAQVERLESWLDSGDPPTFE